MRAGDIIFVRGNNWLSKVVTYFDPGEFSHVAIAVSESDIFEAQYYMRANTVPMHYTNYVTVPLNLNEAEIEKLKVICTMLKGKWYDYKQILGYVLKAELDFNESYFNNPRHLICSEALGLILYMLDKIDSPLPNVTPNGLFRLVKGGLLHG
jgi:hypothetical protein